MKCWFQMYKLTSTLYLFLLPQGNFKSPLWIAVYLEGGRGRGGGGKKEGGGGEKIKQIWLNIFLSANSCAQEQNKHTSICSLLECMKQYSQFQTKQGAYFYNMVILSRNSHLSTFIDIALLLIFEKFSTLKSTFMHDCCNFLLTSC